MKQSIRFLFFSTAAFLIASALFASQPLVVPLNGSTSFSMSVPDGWRVQQRAVGGGVDLRIRPEEKGDFLVRITMLPKLNDSSLSTPEAVKAAVVERGTMELSGAMQTKLELVELKLFAGGGTLFHMTDRNHEKGPGDYRELHQGMMLVGHYLAAVTILTHSGDDVTVKQAIAMLESARITDASQKAQ